MEKIGMKAPKRNTKPCVEVTIIYEKSEEDKYEVQQYQNGNDAGDVKTDTSSS